MYTRELWAQVGSDEKEDPNKDHKTWGRADELEESHRKCYKVDKSGSKNGADIAAEVAAAFSATAILFKNEDENYSNELIRNAESLFTYAKTHRGLYSDVIPGASKSHHYRDELCWGGAWLYKATGKTEYLDTAKYYWKHDTLESLKESSTGFTWDNKMPGVGVLLAGITKDDDYFDNGISFCEKLRDNTDTVANGKMVFLNEFAPNRRAATQAFVCMVLTKYLKDDGRSGDFNEFAKDQLHYMLGDSGRSFVTGFGNNPPKRAHHRGVSCPDRPADCDWGTYNDDNDNFQELPGALVGGPNKDGVYVDKRENFKGGEVTINAGFLAAMSGLAYLESEDICP